MGKNLFFDYCSIPIFVIILVSIYIRNSSKGRSNQYFIALNYLSLGAVIFDVMLETLSARVPLSGTQTELLTLASYGYFLLRNFTLALYMLFLYSVTRTEYRLRRLSKRIVFFAPYGLVCLCLLLNPAFGWIFRISPDRGYERGDLILVLYGVSAFYALMGVGHLIRYRGMLDKEKWLAYLGLYLMNFFAVGFQFFMPRYLVEIFGTAMAFLLITLLVFRPEEVMDSNVGLLSWRAYQADLRKILATRQPVQIVAATFTNATVVRNYLGETRFYSYISRMAAEIADLNHERGNPSEIYYESPGTLYTVLSGNSVHEKVEALLPELRDKIDRHTSDISHTGARLEASICCIRVPEDVSSYEEILHLGHNFRALIPSDQIFTKASSLIDSRDYEIYSKMEYILERAITKRAFEMYYQPIYSVQDGKFRSAEALIRLKDRDFGFISPAVFIPAAEQLGLILPIGDFVLESVFRFISQHNLPLLGLEYIELNLSVAQCMQTDLPEKIFDLEKKYRISPDQVNLEITETSFENNAGLMTSNLNVLADNGYRFALDDYGTGYSNIQRVSRLPLSIVKIDKSLVDDMNTPDGFSIVRNTVRMMKDIRKEIVVEGVEDKKTLSELADMGCDFIQGYYFSKPIPAEEFIEFLKKHNL
ncbi:MAG: EAL domain-containing protein [Lachnospiraceae bacterium]|nr:EAL domain-containing protein [Lachnospiraceae bacterium]